VKVINAGPEPIRTTLNIQGLRSLGPEAEMTVLTSGEASDNNSMENPTKVVPVTTRTRLEGREFAREFPPFSFTLLRVKAE
jgi:alpha-L-arabinofuranosidase